MSRRLPAFAATVHRRRKAVLAALVVAFALAAAAGGKFSADYSTPGSESKAAAQVLKSFPASSPETIDVVWQTQGADLAKVDGFLTQAASLEGIGDARHASQATVSPDGKVAVVRLALTEPLRTCPRRPARSCSRCATRWGRPASSSAARSSRPPSRADLQRGGRPH